ncbi:MAG: coenzyme F430 synthase [Candidatus Nezhaarchaeales archaeon]
MDGLKRCRVLVVDMTHGGQVLCEELLRRGCVVHCFDNHRTLSEDSIKRLKSIGVEVHRDEAEIPDVELFDVVIVQHADPRLKIFSNAIESCVPIMTHARAVGIILSEEKGSTKIIEVTGTNGKTTVCNIIAKAASDQGLRVLVHDSINTRIVNGDSRVIAEGLSITPANIMRAWRLAEEEKIKPDVCIFEVSLGGTGAADIGVVTGIYENYKVSFMINAFNSKLQMALNMDSDKILVLNGDNKPTRRFIHVFRGRTNMYGFDGGHQVKGRLRDYEFNRGMVVEGEVYELNVVDGGKISCSFNFKLKPQLFGRYQASNALAALTASLSLGLKLDDVCKSISEFEGVSGRSKAIFEEWGLIVECRNRGVNIPAITSALNEALGLKKSRKIEKVIAVIGGTERAACEIVDAARLAAWLREIDDIDLYILYGPLGARLSELNVKGYITSSLQEALLLAKREASKTLKTIVVVCGNEA